MPFAEQDFAGAQGTNISDRFEPVPTTLHETDWKTMSRTNQYDAFIGDHMIDVFRAAKDAAFALTLRCHQYDSVASQREEIFIRSVVGKTAIDITLAVDVG